MAYEQTRLDRPLSRLELAVAVILISIFIVYFLNRIIIMTIAAEDHHLELKLSEMRSGLMIYASTKLIEGDYEAIRNLTVTNPFTAGFDSGIDVIAVSDINAAGVLQPGRWYYDTGNNEIIYRVNNDDYFRNLGGDEPWVRLAVRLNYRDRNGDGVYTRGTDRPQGLSLAVLNDYEWTY